MCIRDSLPAIEEDKDVCNSIGKGILNQGLEAAGSFFFTYTLDRLNAIPSKYLLNDETFPALWTLVKVVDRTVENSLSALLDYVDDNLKTYLAISVTLAVANIVFLCAITVYEWNVFVGKLRIRIINARRSLGLYPSEVVTRNQKLLKYLQSTSTFILNKQKNRVLRLNFQFLHNRRCLPPQVISNLRRCFTYFEYIRISFHLLLALSLIHI
eukprot:TRINITY_DN17577_c0_g1_i2.p1 TRINITY_DN17577_c0_g1~~TRINITY_DN17577_c0_g1_i2.p1  ORF type:complete len:231 (-),score=17.27 TRINITY_DN17577_c0_g1_i2:60-695(-)